MATRSKPLLALLSVLLLVAGGCGRGGNGAPGPAEPQGGEEEDQGPPAADFQLGDVRLIDSADRPESPSVADSRIPKVVELVNNYYNNAFLDPGKWGDGAHPELANLFTEEAKPNVAPRIGILALGDVSRALTEVTPDKQQIDRLTLYFDTDINQPLGAVTTSFEATATPTDEGGGPVKIVHTGTFWLQPEGDGFRISAFDANINIGQGAA